ncbi:hypothetical protein BJ875DRAFT_531822 [Amylocarpus encephaloides]|uniref:Fe2OG dioxygenase domain-containing protein n=1 Tax=Amylocarpus encephaloides TaxID=45428 RepID=A0A9P7YU75_9HELO|nr:hypothetical protein BJ875DRAFT_531822 [Amylocarpus encephaloides]
MLTDAPPILDFSAFYGVDEKAKTQLVEDVKKCCLHNGFFQIVGHKVSTELQEKTIKFAKEFFALPQEQKNKFHKDQTTWNRGYETMGSQILEAGTLPDLKEGFYIGEEISKDHPYFVQKKLNSGPNVWPTSVSDAKSWETTSMEYYKAMHALARDVLVVIGQTLDLGERYFDPFTTDAIATLRYLHYPPQPKDSDAKLSRGIGAHTDFGSVTLLMQDEVDGLQVWEVTTNEWLDVVPTKGAYVVNLGNMFMRWSNDRYFSNLHRVINKSGKERYSIPFFYSGNPDYVIDCLPNCKEEGETSKYPPITVEETIRGSYKASYGAADAYKKQQTTSYGEGLAMKLDDKDNREFYGSSISDSYRLKSELVSKSFKEIEMGRYQWELFVVTGFGWITDNFWSQGIGTIQPSIKLEFADVTMVGFSSIAYYAGLIFGASFWGISADFIGRKPAFNATLLIGGVFGAAVAGLSNFVGFCVMWAIIGTAAGGNVPVDSMIFLEFVPGSHQYLLTALSAWWNFGQVVVSLVGWVFLANFTCPTDSTPETCKRADNMGWRYVMITLGGMALVFAIIRLFVFKMPESPRYLLSKGRDAEAVEAVNYVARRNKKPEPLHLGMFQDIDRELGITVNEDEGRACLSHMAIMKGNLADFKSANYKDLFATRKLAQHTTIIWLIWLTIGIAYPLYFNFLPTYLAQKFTENNSLDLTYRNYCITSAVGVVGPISAAFAVNTRFGRRWMMGGSAIVAGIFLFGYTGATTPTGNLAFSCVTGLLGNFTYAIMYAFTPESFPGPHRGTGSGTAATLLRLGGLAASLIGTYTNFSVVPIYVSAVLWILVGVVSFGLPFETHGRSAI